MFSSPFHDLLDILTPGVMQAYVVLMFLAVVGGTIIDVIHKKSAQYFFENAQKAQKSAKRSVTGGEKVSLAISTLTNAAGNPWLLVTLWHLGALSVCVGGYWFWFFIRVDLNSEGNPWYRLVRADLFILSLLGTTTFGLLWSLTRWADALSMLFFIFFVAAATTLFTTVLWSKFAHMFFKPAAAYQKKITKADGSQENLPDIGDLSDPEVQARYPDIATYMGEKPEYMGLGIKRESPNHY